MIQFIRHRTARFLAGVVGSYALVVMFGWIFNIDQLTRILPTGINMKFITAFLFFFSAAGLYSMSLLIQDESENAFVALPGIALIIFLTTVTLFVGWVSGTSTGVEILFVHPTGPLDFSGALSTEGWPSVPTMVDFMLFGLVCITSLSLKLRGRFLTYAGYFILLTGVIAVAGYETHLPALYYQVMGSQFSQIPMAFNTALAFIILGFGLTRVYKPEGIQ